MIILDFVKDKCPDKEYRFKEFYIYIGPNTNLFTKIYNLNEVLDAIKTFPFEYIDIKFLKGSKPRNSLDRLGLEHDLLYHNAENKPTKKRDERTADELLIRRVTHLMSTLNPIDFLFDDCKIVKNVILFKMHCENVVNDTCCCTLS